MTRLVRFANNAVTRLAANISSSATTLSVTPGDGAKFPTISGGQYFMATLVKSDGTTEVVKVTARATDTFTVVRAAEAVAGASTAYAFSANDKFEMRLTAGALGGELDRLELDSIAAQNKSANYTVTATDVNSLIRTDTSAGAVSITLPQISTLTNDFDVIVAKVTSDANLVAVNRSGTDTINGAAAYNLTSQYQSVWLIADRSTNTWTAINSGTGGVNAVVDSGTGSGSATVTLSGDPGSKNNVAFYVGNVYQQKSTYSISGTTLTAGGNIPSGVVWEAVWSTPLVIGTPADGTVSTAKLAANAVTYAKMQSVTAGKVLGRDTSGAGVVQELPIAVDSSGNVCIATASTLGNSSLNVNAGVVARTAAASGVIPYFQTYNGNAGSDLKTWRIGGNSSGDLIAETVNDAYSSATGRFSVDSSGNFKLNSGYGSVATAYGCRAWVNFNGTGTVAIRASGNVSSITDNGTGDYTVNLTTAMPDTNGIAQGAAVEAVGSFSGGQRAVMPSFASTSTIRVGVTFQNGGVGDCPYVGISVFR